MKLKNSGRYSTEFLTEGFFEPGSQNRVYKNLLGITKKREINKLECQELLRASKEIFATFDSKHKFTEQDIKNMHATWLAKIYPWAGEYRQINLSKDGFYFAAANRISTLMKNLEKNELNQHTPCNFKALEKVITAIAIIHVELILIHPFREGNGRISRIFANLMALQAGLPPLDFGNLKGSKRQEYFAAIRAGLDKNYTPMIKIFESVIKRTLKNTKQINVFSLDD